MNFDVELKTELKVEFTDPDKAHKYFIEDDSEGAWRNFFFKYYDLRELAEHIAEVIVKIPERWDDGNFARDFEGFALFNRSGDKLISVAEEYGSIIVRGDEDDTYVEWCTEEND